MRKKYIAEFIGTFAIVFCGTGAIIINQLSNGTVSHLGIAATFGLTVMVMIYSLGGISGAHFNPAVTLGFAFAKRLPYKELLPYILAQIAGAFVASGILKLLFPENDLLGISLPAGSDMQSFILEIILAFFLVFVILNVTVGYKETAGIAIGSTIILCALFAGPISGASMNPARSIAPAVISMHLEHLWIYIVAPIIGSLIAVGATTILHEHKKVGF